MSVKNVGDTNLYLANIKQVKIYVMINFILTVKCYNFTLLSSCLCY